MADSTRRRRRQKHWWTIPLGIVVGYAGVFAAAASAMYVTEHLQSWAAPIVWAALALCALAAVGYFTSKVNGGVAFGIVAYTVILAMGVSLAEGWKAQAQTAMTIVKVAFGLGWVALIIGVIVLSVRANRHVYAPLREELREIGEQIHTDALFRDDGERIVVYPRRWRLLRLSAGQVVFVVVCALGVWWAVSNAANPIVTVGIGLFLVLIAFILLLNLARLLMPGPTLVIGPDGVLDRGSQIVTGRGLLRWDELIAVSEYTYKPNMLSPTNRWLMILLTDAKAVRERQPFIKRALAFLGKSQVPNTISLTSSLIDQLPHALAEKIKAYARSHAPSGWDSPLIAEEGEDEHNGEEETDGGKGIS